jgi:hypothetical protein
MRWQQTVKTSNAGTLVGCITRDKYCWWRTWGKSDFQGE